MMDNKARNCKVTIFGDCYSLVTTEHEEHVSRAAHLVDATIQEIVAKSTHVDEKKVAILAALRIASKVLSLEQELEKGKLKEQHLVEAIDKALNGDTSALV